MPLNYYLQPNPITPDPNDRSARVDITERLYEQDIIQKMLKRGTMVTETDIKAILQLLFDVIADEVANGASVVLPVANWKPSIKGVFKDANDEFDKTRHTLRVSVSAGKLVIERVKSGSPKKIKNSLPSPEIISFKDVKSQSIDSILSPGSIGVLTGEELKFDANQADEGIFFVDSDDNETKVSVIASLTEGQITFGIPELEPGDYQLVVRRAYTSNRTIRNGALDDVLTVASPET